MKKHAQQPDLAEQMMPVVNEKGPAFTEVDLQATSTKKTRSVKHDQSFDVVDLANTMNPERGNRGQFKPPIRTVPALSRLQSVGHPGPSQPASGARYSISSISCSYSYSGPGLSSSYAPSSIVRPTASGSACSAMTSGDKAASGSWATGLMAGFPISFPSLLISRSEAALAASLDSLRWRFHLRSRPMLLCRSQKAHKPGKEGRRTLRPDGVSPGAARCEPTEREGVARGGDKEDSIWRSQHEPGQQRKAHAPVCRHSLACNCPSRRPHTTVRRATCSVQHVQLAVCVVRERREDSGPHSPAKAGECRLSGARQASRLHPLHIEPWVMQSSTEGAGATVP